MLCGERSLPLPHRWSRQHIPLRWKCVNVIVQRAARYSSRRSRTGYFIGVSHLEHPVSGVLSWWEPLGLHKPFRDPTVKDPVLNSSLCLASRRRFCGLAFALRKLLPLNCRVRVTLLLFMWGEYTLNVFPKMSNVFQNVAYFVWFFLLSVKFSKGHRPRFMTPPRLMNPILDVL